VIDSFLPYVLVPLSTFLLTLLLTPIVRELARRFGMVDKPDPRRINKVPIPRGGGIAIVIGVYVPYVIFHFVSGRPWLQGVSDATCYKMFVLAVAIALLGLVDDRYSLRPRVKLLGQLVIAFLVWFWAGLGFHELWPQLPIWVDCLLTVFWLVGAVNAFNLIDGLDGLASGLSLIAIVGMAGSLFFARNPQIVFFYFAVAGALVGFLRYNYHPASVFLGDSGSMFLGFTVAALPLASQAPNSFMVSVGVPLLAMGVPIFDTTLAIIRRSLRRRLNHAGKTGEVMTADSDHLHHRLLRAAGFNQRKAAWTLYALAAAGVSVGLVAMTLQSRAAGLWLAALAVAAVIVFKDAYIELFDAGMVLNTIARTQDEKRHRHYFALSTPLSIFFDVALLIGAFFVCCWSLRLPIDLRILKTMLPLRVAATFAFLVFFKVYLTVWARAMLSNYVRLFLACLLGTVTSTVLIYYWPSLTIYQLKAMTLSYAVLSFVLLCGVRCLRGLVRDLFYAIDCSRLRTRKDVSRILVYGCGLRYRSFRRELVRTTAANDRMIVGLLDDDTSLRGHYIGGIRIYGTINEAPKIINELNVDAVVIACAVSDDWLKVIKEILLPTDVKVTRFSIGETSV